MKITSVLLSATAALSFVSGAYAADAVVAAAPEPMDYVRVCDAFGTGYFYIPGTETCLKLSGFVRYDIGFANGDNYFSTNTTTGRLEINTGNDTEFGQAYSFIRLQGSTSNNVNNRAVFDVDADKKTIADANGNPTIGTRNQFDGAYYAGIGGFEFGAFDSQWAKFFGYGLGVYEWGGDYIDWNNGWRQYVSYTAELGSVKAYVSAENDGEKTNFAPSFSGGINASVGSGSVGLGLGYDTSNSTYALKGVARGKAGAVDFGLMGLYASGAGNSYNAHEGWGVIGGVGAQVSDKINVSLTTQYFQNSGGSLDKAAGFTAGANVTWAVASGFTAFVEGYHEASIGKTSGFLRLQRDF